MVKNGSKWSKMDKIAKNGKGPPARSRGPETSMLYIILQEKNILDIPYINLRILGSNFASSSLPVMNVSLQPQPITLSLPAYTPRPK